MSLPPTPAPLTVWQYLTIDLVSGEEILDRKRVAFTLSDLPPRNTIQAAVWQDPWTSYVSFHVHARLREVGFDATESFFQNSDITYNRFGTDPASSIRRGREEIATLAGLRYIPPIIRFRDMGMDDYTNRLYVSEYSKDKIRVKPNVRTPCLNNPEYLAGVRHRTLRIAELFGKMCSRDYLMDEETSFAGVARKWDGGEVCFCAHCQAHFRGYLKKEYGSLAAVNAEYATRHASFDEIRGVPLAGVMGKPNLYPLWADYRMAMDSVHAEFFALLRDTLREKVPDARVGDGFTCTDSCIAGEAGDAWKLSRVQGIQAPYFGYLRRIRADFARPGTLVAFAGGWGNVTRCGKVFQSVHQWRSLFEGCNFFNEYYGDTIEGFLSHDLTEHKPAAHITAQLREIKRGIGKMLAESDRQHSGVALLYSMASIHHWVLTKAGDGEDIWSREMQHNMYAWIRLLDDLNGQCRHISYAQLSDGILARDTSFKVLVLPRSQALSPAEIKAIKEFVKAGGTLLADLRPGVSDGHCKPYGKPPLDPVFGVRQDSGSPVLKRAMVQVWSDEQGGRVPLGEILTDLSLRDGPGAVAGVAGVETPALIVNQYGRGKAILLNFSIDNYATYGNTFADDSRSVHAPRLLAFMKHLLRDAGLRPAAEAFPELTDLRQYAFHSGNIRYLGLTQDPPGYLGDYARVSPPPLVSKRTTLLLRDAAHIYDCRTRRYVGRTDRFSVYMQPDEVKLFAMLPYRVTGVTVDAPDVVKQGTRAAYTVRLGSASRPEKHVLRVSVFGPGGDEIRHYARNVSCEGGVYAGVLTLALDEEIGHYGITVRDAATGIEGKAVVKVTAR